MFFFYLTRSPCFSNNLKRICRDTKMFSALRNSSIMHKYSTCHYLFICHRGVIYNISLTFKFREICVNLRENTNLFMPSHFSRRLKFHYLKNVNALFFKTNCKQTTMRYQEVEPTDPIRKLYKIL